MLFFQEIKKGTIKFIKLLVKREKKKPKYFLGKKKVKWREVVFVAHRGWKSKKKKKWLGHH